MELNHESQLVSNKVITRFLFKITKTLPMTSDNPKVIILPCFNRMANGFTLSILIGTRTHSLMR